MNEFKGAELLQYKASIMLLVNCLIEGYSCSDANHRKVIRSEFIGNLYTRMQNINEKDGYTCNSLCCGISAKFPLVNSFLPLVILSEEVCHSLVLIQSTLRIPIQGPGSHTSYVMH